MLRKEKELALQMRKQGMSYSQIKEKVKVSKGTLSNWLSEYPLSDERIRELRGNSSKRIERYRQTMQEKRNQKFVDAYKEAQKAIGIFSDRDLLIAGFFLYWGEGGKTDESAVTFANTDLKMVQVFIVWLKSIGIQESDLKIRLQLYKDMDYGKETAYWSQALTIPLKQFRRPYVKGSNRNGLTYKSKHTHGTCNVIVHDTAKRRFVLMAIKYLAEQVITSRM